MGNNPFGKCLWIAGDKECQSPVILRRFSLNSAVKKATLFITGLGYFKAQINGEKVTEYRFLPLITDYEERDKSRWNYPLFDTLTHRIYYSEFDITSLLNTGENVLSIELGNGFYRQKERICEGDVSFGDTLKTVYRIDIETETENITLCSDGSEVWYCGDRVYNNLYIGEIIDRNKADYIEKSVDIIPAPKSEMCLQIGTPDKVIRKITPTLLGEFKGKKIYDAGENISGIVRGRVTSAKGEKTILHFSEEINEDLSLDPSTTGVGYVCSSGKPQYQEDIFISDGKGCWFEPEFVWHTFRYFEVEGSLEDTEVLVIHSDTPVTSNWDSSSEGLNFLYDAFIRTQLDNMHGSIPSDCPHRERLGYTGDGQICAPSVMMLIDSREFYDKWIVDILDCQDKKSGHVQHTAPLMGGGGGPGGWGGAIVMVPYAYYLHYGDIGMLEKCYLPMKRYIEYMQSHCENGLVVREEDKGWCLGDWASIDKMEIPEPYVNSCYLIKMLSIMEEIAALTGNSDDISEFSSFKEIVTKAVKQEYLNTEGTAYCNSVQGSDAFAVWAGIEGEILAERIARRYDEMQYLDTGFLCTDILFEVLFKYGFYDTALALLESEKIGSFLNMKRNGATTVWEYLDGRCSHCHPMFAACVRQLFTSILGITQRDGTAGYSNIVIAPCIPEKLQNAKGSIETSVGEISVSWIKTGANLKFEISLPKDITAEFVLNSEKKLLSGGKNEFEIRV